MGLRCHANRYGYRQKASSDYLYDITKFKSLLGNTVELQKQEKKKITKIQVLKDHYKKQPQKMTVKPSGQSS